MKRAARLMIARHRPIADLVKLMEIEQENSRNGKLNIIAYSILDMDLLLDVEYDTHEPFKSDLERSNDS